ncbi:MAG: YwbE family protein [Thaumarchaeota archaeon]|jgi:uncharacterized repeat protein (TIGR03833 family)|nr:YwbE family protein [Nitrososphaerota archaeon]
MTDIPSRDQIKPGTKVGIETKKDQGTGKISIGIVKNILTKNSVHPHGIKVELEDGQVGRVKELFLGTGKIIKKESRENDGEFTTITSETKGPGDLDYEVNATVIIDPENTAKELDNTSIPKHENEHTEFKATFQYDLKEEQFRLNGDIKAADGRKNDSKNNISKIKKEIAIAIAAFANKTGGRLFIGVDDDSSVLGLDGDLKKCENSIETFERSVSEYLKRMLKNNAFVSGLQFQFGSNDDKSYLIIHVPPATKAIWINIDENNQEFYVRMQNNSQKFSPEDMLRYCNERFPN